MSVPLPLAVGATIDRQELSACFRGQSGQVARDGTVFACFYTCDRYPEDVVSTTLLTGGQVDAVQWQVEGGYEQGTGTQVRDQSLSAHESPRNAMLNKQCVNNDRRIASGEPLYPRHCVHFLYREKAATPFTYGGLFVPCEMTVGEGDEDPATGRKFRTYTCTLRDGRALGVSAPAEGGAQ